MSSPGTHALRFAHPDLDAGGASGLSPTPSGTLALIDGDATIRQSLLLLLSTMPGERVMRPNYGCPLHRLVFQPLDDTTAGLAIHYVERAVRRWEPRVDVLDVDAGRHPDADNALLVTLRYRVRASHREASLALVVDLVGP